MTAPAAPAPGFYADPLDPAGQRWWDGSAWTETVRAADDDPDGLGLDRRGDVLDHDEPALGDEPDEDDPDFVPRLVPDPLPARTQATPAVVAPVVVVAEEQALSVEQPGETSVAPEASAASAVPAGLYPDPYGQALLRWWDGTQWTTQTSDGRAPDAPPIPPQLIPTQPTSPQPTAPHPAAGMGGQGGFPNRPDVLPPSRRPGGGWARSTPPSRRPSVRVVAAAAIVLVSIGVRVYFLLDHGDPPRPPAQVAQSINLRPGDLPGSWTPQAKTSADADQGERALSASNDTGAALARCLGAPDPAKSEVYSATSPTYTSGTAEVSSDVTVVKDANTAAADLRAMRSPKVATCVSTVANPGDEEGAGHPGDRPLRLHGHAPARRSGRTATRCA